MGLVLLFDGDQAVCAAFHQAVRQAIRVTPGVCATTPGI